MNMGEVHHCLIGSGLTEGTMSKKKKLPDSPQPATPKRTPAEVKRWTEMQREIDNKLKELLYEDRNGYKPPKPWYED